MNTQQLAIKTNRNFLDTIDFLTENDFMTKNGNFYFLTEKGSKYGKNISGEHGLNKIDWNELAVQDFKKQTINFPADKNFTSISNLAYRNDCCDELILKSLEKRGFLLHGCPTKKADSYTIEFEGNVFWHKDIISEIKKLAKNNDPWEKAYYSLSAISKILDKSPVTIKNRLHKNGLMFENQPSDKADKFMRKSGIKTKWYLNIFLEIGLELPEYKYFQVNDLLRTVG